MRRLYMRLEYRDERECVQQRIDVAVTEYESPSVVEDILKRHIVDSYRALRAVAASEAKT